MTGETITVYTRGVTGQDSDGNDVYGDTTTTPIDGCVVWQRDTSELVQGQDTNIEQINVVFPAGTAITALDQIGRNGDRYDVDGTPQNWVSPFSGWAPGVQIVATKVTG